MAAVTSQTPKTDRRKRENNTLNYIQLTMLGLTKNTNHLRIYTTQL